MAKTEWYVVQVGTGRELAMCELIERACKAADAERLGDKPLINEVFSPRYRSQYKLQGEWHDEDRLLLPGYVVVVTDNPWELARVLHGVSGLTRILTMGEAFAPLSNDDRSWIERWTTEGDRTIPMSVAYKEGDRVVVTSGPLKGYEAMIVRIKRRQSLAELEIHAGALTIRTTVGLAVLPERSEEGLVGASGETS